MELQIRTFEIDSMEVRQLDGRTPVIAGYAIVFDSWSDVITDTRGRRFRERIAPTTFDRALESGKDIRALWSHDRSKPLARTRNGTLRLTKDGKGIHVEIDAPATSWGADAVESIKRGDTSGMSFAYAVNRNNGDTWSRGGVDGIAEHVVLDADLFEVSPVTEPAYPATSVYVRSVVPDFDESDSRAAGEIAAMGDGQERDALTLQDYELSVSVRERRIL